MRAVVGIDASRYAAAQRTGTETYSFELLNALATMPGLPFDVRLYANQIPADGWKALEKLGAPRVMPFPRFWTHARLSTEMARNAPDLLFVPSHVVPLVHPPSVVTIHDLGYLHEPDAHPRTQRLMLDATTRWNARSRHIIAISETTRQDLIARYSVPAERIAVVPHGVHPRFTPAPLDQCERVRARYGLPERFVLALGTIQPRKNLVRLARAVANLDGVALVTVGRRGWMAEGVCADVQQILHRPGQWIEPGYVPLEDLPALISTAGTLALLSTYEGFGLPVLEAMSCATPVVISDTPALVEIAGGAARIAPRTDESAIAAQLFEALNADRRTDPYVLAGLRHAATFTWRRCAEETVTVLEGALGA